LKRKREAESYNLKNRPRASETTQSRRNFSSHHNHGLAYKPLARPSSALPPPPRTQYGITPPLQRSNHGGRLPQRLSSSAAYSPPPSARDSFAYFTPVQDSYTRPLMSPVMQENGNHQAFPLVGGYPSLPPGAYVNPAFFSRSNDQRIPSHNLPLEIQHQMDILKTIQQQPK
jgi:hypothetical protein